MSQFSSLSQQMADEAVYRALSLFIGDGRRYSVDDIEIGVPGMKARTVSSWIAHSIENRRAPKMRDLLCIARFLRPDERVIFMSKLLSAIGLGAHDLTPQPDDPAMIIASLVSGAGTFAVLGADHVYCHVDRRKLEPVADSMIATLTPFSSNVKD